MAAKLPVTHVILYVLYNCYTLEKATHVLKPSGRESEEYRIVTVVKLYEPPSKEFLLRVGDVVELLGKAPVKGPDGSLMWRGRMYNDNFEFVEGLLPLDVVNLDEEESPRELEQKKR